MADRMHALTIWQPWATMIAEGVKPFEFRRWQAPRRFWGQRIAIHAGKRMLRRDEIDAMLTAIETSPDSSILDPASARRILSRAWDAPELFPRSSILCTAVLGTPLSPAEVRGLWGNDSDREEHFQWAWPLAFVERLEPVVPARGAQGFWIWDGRDG
jgi:hypothetical protein